MVVNSLLTLSVCAAKKPTINYRTKSWRRVQYIIWYNAVLRMQYVHFVLLSMQYWSSTMHCHYSLKSTASHILQLSLNLILQKLPRRLGKCVCVCLCLFIVNRR